MSVGETEEVTEEETSVREASWGHSDAASVVEEEVEEEAEEVSIEEMSLEMSLEVTDDDELRGMKGAVSQLRDQLAARRRQAEQLLAEAHLSEHQQRKRER